jgi:rod shape-determining protein MreD
MKEPSRRVIATVLCGGLIGILVAQTNHYLAPWHTQLWVGGLLVTFASLRLEYREGLISVLLLGALHDAASPVGFGLHAFLFGIAHGVVFNLRNRFPREEALFGIIVALLANLGLFLVFSFTRVADLPQPGASWARLFADLLISQGVLAVVTPWLLAMQERALEIAGVSLRVEQRGVM